MMVESILESFRWENNMLRTINSKMSFYCVSFFYWTQYSHAPMMWLASYTTIWQLDRATIFSTINPSFHKMELWAREFRGGRPHDPKLAWYSQEPSYMLTTINKNWDYLQSLVSIKARKNENRCKNVPSQCKQKGNHL